MADENVDQPLRSSCTLPRLTILDLMVWTTATAPTFVPYRLQQYTEFADGARHWSHCVGAGAQLTLALVATASFAVCRLLF